MNHKWFVNILSIFFMTLLALPARGQLDTCIDFESVALNSFPAGWTAVLNEGQSSTDVSIRNIYGRQGLRIKAEDTYVSLPDLGVDYSSGVYLQLWAYFSNVLSYMEVGTMTDPTNPLTFHPLSTIGARSSWQRYSFDLSEAPSGDHYLSFRVYNSNVSTGSSYVTIDNVRLMSNACGASNFHIEDMTADSITFAWNSVGTPWVTLTMVEYMGSTYTSDRLTSGVTLPYDGTREYEVRIVAICDSLDEYCSSNYNSGWVRVPDYDPSTCVDGTMLWSSKVTPYYGTFDNPYSSVGVIDVGSTNADSRHTVNIDTSLRDHVVGSPLRVIPEGETWSVRLGNWLTGAQAEAMLYRIPVDTTQFDMLILKYAAVMEDPSHTPENQPRFRIEMLDEEMNLIAPAACNSYDFIASSELGWNNFGSNVLWKDWTIVGIDLSGYHNRKVLLRLTTYDCEQSGHYGYAYYNLSCAQKSISFLSCTGGDSNVLAAPEGFTYRWHRDDSDVTVSTNRIATIPMDNHTWYCELGFIGDPNCSVTMNVLSRLVAPVSAFDYEVSRDNCRFKVQLHNRSHLTDDTVTRCAYWKWIFENGDTSLLSDPVLYWSDTGAHTITLVSGLGSGDCFDTLTRTLSFDLVHDTTVASICAGETYSIGDSIFDTTGIYTAQLNCDSLRTLYLTVNDTFFFDVHAVACSQYTYRDSVLYESGTYDFLDTTVNGCDSLYRLYLTIYPTYDTIDSVFVCPGYPYSYRGVDYGGPTDFVANLHTRYDCDSTVHVSLVAADSGFSATAFYSFDNSHWIDSIPIKGCAPSQFYLRNATPHAVNWLWTLTIGDTASSIVAASTAVFPFEDSTSHAILDLKVESTHGCRDSLQWPVIIFPAPEAEFAWDPLNPVDAIPDANFFSLSQPEDCDYYRWFMQREAGASTYDTLEGKQTHYHWSAELPTGDFEVRMAAYRVFHYDTLVHTCSDTAGHTVTIVTAFLEFPNLVTPDGDGVNDVWEVVNLVDLGLYTMNELWIYDSWGALVYHAKNINSHDQAWNPLDTRSPDGTYYFRFSAKNRFGLIRRNGMIEVIRQQ